jgi:oligopeptide transport system substrate-binding protein
MKTVVPTLFAALACIFGCHKKEPSPPPPPLTALQTICVSVPAPLASLHPHTGIDLYCRTTQRALFEGLTRLDPQGKPVLAGSSHIEIDPTQTVYTFTLRPTMRWTNGEPVTAYHYEKAWKMALKPGSNCLRSDLFYCIKNAKEAKMGQLSLDEVGVRALNEHLLVVELEHPSPYFLDLIAAPIFSPLFDDHSIPSTFNGPFYIGQYLPDTKIFLKKNYGYWAAAHVVFETIEINFIDDATTALHLYEKGELDWVGHPFSPLPLDALEHLALRSDFHSTPIDGVYWLSLNTGYFPLSSAKIRKAFSIALDREALSLHVLNGETPTKSVIPTGIALLGESDLYSDNNIPLAKTLFAEGLQELGLNTFPPLTLSHSNIPGQKKLAESLQERWQNVLGIEVKLQTAEWNVFFARLGERQFQIGGCIWYSMFHDPIYYLEFFKEKTNRYNSPQWENIHYQELLNLANHAMDPKIRQAHLKQAEQILLNEMPVIPLFIYRAKYLKSPHIHGLDVINAGHVDFRWGSRQ